MSCEIQRDWVRCPHSQCMLAGYMEAGWRRALSHYLFFSEPWALTVAFTSLVRTLGQLWCWDLTPNNVIESVLFINENLPVNLRNSIIYRQLPLNSRKIMALLHYKLKLTTKRHFFQTNKLINYSEHFFAKF